MVGNTAQFKKSILYLWLIVVFAGEFQQVPAFYSYDEESEFEEQLPIFELPEQIRSADVLLGRLTYRPLCHTVKKVIQLSDSDEDYDYFPRNYTEVQCIQRTGDKLITKHSQMCHFPGFECVQKYRIITIGKRKRRFESRVNDDWELFQVKVGNCECMLPKMRYN